MVLTKQLARRATKQDASLVKRPQDTRPRSAVFEERRSVFALQHHAVNSSAICA